MALKHNNYVHEIWMCAPHAPMQNARCDGKVLQTRQTMEKSISTGDGTALKIHCKIIIQKNFIKASLFQWIRDQLPYALCHRYAFFKNNAINNKLRRQIKGRTIKIDIPFRLDLCYQKMPLLLFLLQSNMTHQDSLIIMIVEFYVWITLGNHFNASVCRVIVDCVFYYSKYNFSVQEECEKRFPSTSLSSSSSIYFLI